MFEDILQFSDPVIENNIEVANFLGIDEAIAIEGAKEFVDGAKARIKSVVERIAAFIQRITNKVKEVFYKLTKKATYEIDQEIYRKLNAANKELDKAIPGIKTNFRAGFIAARNDADGKIPEGMLAKLNASLEESQKKLDEYEKSSAGEYIDNVLSGSVTADGKHKLVLKAEHVTTVIKKLDEGLKTLEEHKDTLTQAVNTINDETNINSKALSAIIAQSNVTIRIINQRMKIYNALNKAATVEAQK